MVCTVKNLHLLHKYCPLIHTEMDEVSKSALHSSLHFLLENFDDSWKTKVSNKSWVHFKTCHKICFSSLLPQSCYISQSFIHSGFSCTLGVGQMDMKISYVFSITTTLYTFFIEYSMLDLYWKLITHLN